MAESDRKVIRELGRVEVDSARALVVALVEVNGGQFLGARLWAPCCGELRPMAVGLTVAVPEVGDVGSSRPKSDGNPEAIVAAAESIAVPPSVASLGMRDLAKLSQIAVVLSRANGGGSFALSERAAAGFLTRALGSVVTNNRAGALLRRLASNAVGFLRIERLGAHKSKWMATAWRIVGPSDARAAGEGMSGPPAGEVHARHPRAVPAGPIASTAPQQEQADRA